MNISSGIGPVLENKIRLKREGSLCHDGSMDVEADRAPRVQVYSREHPSLPLGPMIGEFDVNGDIRFEHLQWALLADDDDEYLPYFVIERREWSMSWGGQSSGVDVVIEVMNSPYISYVITSLATAGAMTATRLMARIRSEPISEDVASHHAKQWIIRSGGVSAADLRIIGSGLHPKGARWVDLATDQVRYRVGVALTPRGGVSVATESWERV